MRFVSRPTAVPESLKNIGQADHDVVTKKGSPNSKCSSPEVRAALMAMYRKKCYLCEVSVPPDDGEVEHFLPHHPTNPTPAYDWNNLHWSCHHCNSAKRGGRFKDPPQRGVAVKRTLLLNPCEPIPAPCTDLLCFDEDGMAVAAAGPHASDVLVERTVEFLNLASQLSRRQARARRMGKLIYEACCYNEWVEIRDGQLFDESKWPDDKEDSYYRACRFADDVWRTYLNGDKEFSVSMRQVMDFYHSIPAMDIKRMSEIHRRKVNSKLGYLLD